VNRAERRRNESNLKKNTQIINKLTPEQAKLMDKIAEEKASKMSNKYIDKFGDLIDRSMTAALLDFGLELEEAEQIQKNMSELFQEDSIKIEKLEGENIDMTKTEIDVTAAIKELLKAGNEKKEDIETLAYKFSNLSRSMLINAYAKVKKEMGLVKETISKEIVYANFEKNAVRFTGKQMVENAMNKFGFTDSTAKTYYSKWKKEYMADKTSNDPLLPKKATIETATQKEIEDNAEKIIVTAKEIQCIESTTTVGQAPVINNVEVVEVKGLKLIEEKVIKTIKVQGENGVYAADTTTGVVLSRDNMIIGFGSLKELEIWVTEVKAVFAMVG
jgi:hypothetical protein